MHLCRLRSKIILYRAADAKSQKAREGDSCIRVGGVTRISAIEMVHGVRATVLGVKAELRLEQGTGISLSLMKELKIPTAWPGMDFWEPLHMRSGSAGMTAWTDPPKEIPKIQQVTQRAGALRQSNEDSGRISAFLRS